MFDRIKSFVIQQKYLVVAGWLLLLLLCLPTLSHISLPFKVGGFVNPRASSEQTISKMTKQGLWLGLNRFLIVYQHDRLSVYDPIFIQELSDSLKNLGTFPIRLRITTPYSNPNQIAKSQHAAYVVVSLESNEELDSSLVAHFKTLLIKPAHLSMSVGGYPVFLAEAKYYSQRDLDRAESVALLVTFMLLIFIYASITTVIIAISISAASAIISVTILYWLGLLFPLSVFVLNIATLICVALTLDYTFFITRRFHEELLHRRHSTKDAIAVTQVTAMKAVFFSGLAVLLSFTALLFFPINLLFSAGIAGIVVIVVCLLCVTTLLPALFVILGEKTFSLTFRKLDKPLFSHEKNFWHRLGLFITKRPLLIFIPTFLLLLVLAYPFTKVIFNRPDVSILPPEAESRHVFDAFNYHFNATELSPIFVVASAPDNILSLLNVYYLHQFAQKIKQDHRVTRIDSPVTFDDKLGFDIYQYFFDYMLRQDKGVREISPFFQSLSNDRHAMLFSIITTYPANSDETVALIEKIRHSDVGNDIKLNIAGMTPSLLIDVKNTIRQYFPFCVVFILLSNYLILLFLFRSLLLPLKAILMNLLSLAAAYGLVVFVFQEGHLATLLNFKPLGFIDFNLPILLFCGVFGISMDYEVFLLTRIKEHYERSHDNTASIIIGIERSGRTITTLAVIMVFICISFMSAQIVINKAYAFGTAVAVAVDAIIIRSFLVPSTMCLLGNLNWYIPRWLEKRLPDINFHHGYDSPPGKKS